MPDKRPTRSRKGSPSARRPVAQLVPLDAEDIAMARLQAYLREAEAIPAAKGPRVTPLSRTTVRLSQQILQHVRERARRDGATISRVVEAALKRYLKTP